MEFSEQDLIIRYMIGGNKRTLVDVGAHRGSFLKPFASSGWNVIAFEPERTNIRILRNKYRDYPDVYLIEQAVYHTSGLEIPFYTSKKHFGIHSLKPFHETHELSYNVNTTRLDDTLNKLNIDKVDLIKIDIEGADFIALKSFDFRKFNPEIVMTEFMDNRSVSNFGYSHHDIVKYMEKFDYTTYVSEWEPIREYGVEGSKSQHKWIQCIPYPTDHEPAWGNLIFINNKCKEKFETILTNYLDKIIPEYPISRWNKILMKNLPGFIINRLKEIKNIK